MLREDEIVNKGSSRHSLAEEKAEKEGLSSSRRGLRY